MNNNLNVSPNTQNFINSISPNFVITLAGMAVLPFNPGAGGALITAGALRCLVQNAIYKEPEPRKLESLDERFEPLKKLIKKVPPFYFTESWEKGYESDYNLLSKTIERAQRDIEIDSMELKSKIRFLNIDIKFYNSDIKKIKHIFKEGQLKKCKINTPLIDESNNDLKAVKKKTEAIKVAVDQVSSNVANIFSSLKEQAKQEELLQKDLTCIKKWIDEAQPKISKLLKKTKLLNQVQKIKDALDSV